jgi:cell pole-organizing protein PopZ
MTQQPAKSQEPSMEEILASIRRIIADDDASKSPPRPPEPPKTTARAATPSRLSPPAPRPNAGRGETSPAQNGAGGVEDQSSDILDLTESMATPMPREPASAPVPTPSAAPGPSAQFRKIDGHSDVSFDESAEKPQETVDAARPYFQSDADPRGDAERAQLLSHETTAAVDSAFNTLAQTVLVQNARTLEDLVREMLRPMLKSWLDDNLPGMVERLVRAEIERVSRGRIG